MNLLLDTHTFIWFIEDSPELSGKARNAIEAQSTINYISVASLWEIAIKASLNKLQLKSPFLDIHKIIELNSFKILPVQLTDTIIVSTLPFHHKDPFDRIIVSQCINWDFTLITIDKSLENYNIKILW
ncbi:MAG TPA: type II toxin-antitoxin system VapC family toxin [Ferruginibacter sp.]|mgnify:CR=1 FL=1|nr:type II toxin-antitoxin system VapC family toxin [Ferruginibacter sp.]HPH92623.1 type II toxin-antitoxin system VapC family toxin [Ferruginibacter sp.]